MSSLLSAGFHPALRRACALGGACLAVLVLAALPARAQEPNSLIINEWMVNPANPGVAGVDTDREWVELYNPNPYPIDLRNWVVRDSAASGIRPPHVIDRSVIVQCYGYVVLGNTTNTTNNGGVPVDYAYGGALVFANSLDRFVLYSPDSVVVDQVRFASAATSAQDGISRELKNPALDNFNVDGSNWASASVTSVYGNGGRGTPRAQNSAFTPFSGGCSGLESSASSTTSAVAGYRLLSAPIRGLTVGTLAGLNLVQKLPDEFPDAAGPNLFTGYTGNPAAANNGYVVPGSKTTALVPGRGFFWYMYTEGGPPANAPEGTSRRADLPLTLQATGAINEAANSPQDVVTRFSAGSRAGATDQLYLLGNPYNGAFDLSGITASSGVLSEVFQFYTPETGYTVRTRVAGTADGTASDDAAVWEGFFAEFFAAPSFPVDLRYALGAIVQPNVPLGGRSGAAGQLVGLALDGVTATGARTHDEAAGVYVSADATDGWDRFDASKLAPLAGPYATVAPVGPGPDGAPRALAQRSVAAGGAATMPLAFTATEAGRYTLSVRAGAPAGWQVVLTDAATGAATALGAGASYAFDSEAAETSERFTLTVTPDAATAGEEDAAAAGFSLAPVSPNPVAGGSRTVLEVREAQHVRAEVVDALGRRVRVLFDGALGAGGRQALEVGGTALPAGTYVLRVTGEQFSAARMFSVAR